MMSKSEVSATSGEMTLPAAARLRRFLDLPWHRKLVSLALRIRKWIPSLPLPLRLPFGAWWLSEQNALDELLLCQNFEHLEMQFVENFLRPGMTVLDIGAHHGFYTLLASKAVGPSGRVVAFEPSPRELRRLRRHVRINSCQNVEIKAFAVGERRGRAELFVVNGAEDWCNSLRPPATNSDATRVAVNVLSLDACLESSGVDLVDFVKLDVEGAELGVLKGAERMLAAPRRPVMLVEVYDIRTQPWGYRSREIVRLLHEANYTWFELLKNGSVRAVSPDREFYDTNLVAVPNERRKQVLESLEEEF